MDARPRGGRTLPPAVIAHGAGSRPEFVTACLARPLRAVGLRVLPVVLRGHGGDARTTGVGVAEHAADLAEAARREGATVVGGISLGAHAAAHLAVRDLLPGLSGLLLALPAWVGAPDRVAAANSTQADELERDGLPAVVARLRAAAPPWIAEELAASWSRHHLPALVAGLRAAAASSAPTPAELAAVGVPAAVAVATGDPLHPAGVGRAWARALPRSRCAEVDLADIGTDRESLGRALAAAWSAAGVPRPSPSR